MELMPGIIADGRALYLEEEKMLVLSDLHIGYEEELRAGGVLIPLEQREFYKKEVARLCAAHEVDRVILNGDVKHEFGRISQQEWSEVQSFVLFMQEKAIVEVVAGNHDNMLLPIMTKLGIPVSKEILVGKILVTHGDIAFEKLEQAAEADIIILGHEHPAMTLVDGVRSERVPCFLVGEQHKKKMVVMPAFNPLSAGADVLRERPLGPLLASYTGFSAFVVVEDEVLAFGLIENIQRRQR